MKKTDINKKICISLPPRNIKQALYLIKKAEELADIVELRADFMRNIGKDGLKQILIRKKKKMIFSLKTRNISGKSLVNQKKHFELFKFAIERNCEYIDVDLSMPNKHLSELLKNKNDTKIIISFHDFEKTPQISALNKLYLKIKKLNPDLVKIVTYANHLSDNWIPLELLRAKKDIISFCSGDKGVLSRIIAPYLGSCLTYVSLDERLKTAPGQITFSDFSFFNDMVFSSAFNFLEEFRK
ncbi:MAG: type I 3-dehydroquinate dehydratase [archaeon]